MSALEKELSRKTFIKGGGALIVGFSALGAGALAKTAGSATAAVPTAPLGGPWTPLPLTQLDSWLRIGVDGRVTAFTSTFDAGQGTTTGHSQIIADELDVPFEWVTMIRGDTALTPQHGGLGAADGTIIRAQALRYAAAEARLALVNMASTKLGVAPAQLSVANGVVSVTGNPSQKVTYGELMGGKLFNITLRQVDVSPRPENAPYRAGGVAYTTGNAQVKSPGQYKIIGKPIPRVDVPDKVTGKHTYVQNVRLPGMVHARLVLPPTESSKFVGINGFKGAKPAGLIKVVQQGNFIAVVTEHEWQAIEGMRSLDVVWTEPVATLSGNGNLNGSLRSSPKIVADTTVTRVPRAQAQSNNPNRGDVTKALASAAKVLKANYYFPVHAHGSLGPTAAVATVSGGQAVVFATKSGGESSIARVLGIPTNMVRVIYMEGSGFYGRSEEVGAAAALLSKEVGLPVRLQMMREHDFLTDAFGIPQSYRLEAGLDSAGNIVAWDTEVWNWTGNSYGGTLVEKLNGTASTSAFSEQAPQALGGADLNNYEFPNSRFVSHNIAPPLRVGSQIMRSPKRIQSNFAVESFVDELAAAAGVDPLAFRLQQLQNTQKVALGAQPGFDPTHYQRLISTMESLRTAMNWKPRPAPNPASKSQEVVTGRGVAAMANYTNVFGALGAEVEVNRKTGRVRVTKLVNVVDAGLIINPKSARNTVAQGVIFALSRTLHEEVRFDRKQVLSRDWVTYPILRFVDVPDQEVVLVNRPEYWAGGLGEGNEIMVPAVIGNAIFDATGVRMREVPFTPARVRAALKAANAK